MFSECRVCGLSIAHGDICTVCRVGEEGGQVAVWKMKTWTGSIFCKIDDLQDYMPEPDLVIDADAYAAFVRAERKN